MLITRKKKKKKWETFSEIYKAYVNESVKLHTVVQRGRREKLQI